MLFSLGKTFSFSLHLLSLSALLSSSTEKKCSVIPSLGILSWREAWECWMSTCDSHNPVHCHKDLKSWMLCVYKCYWLYPWKSSLAFRWAKTPFITVLMALQARPLAEAKWKKEDLECFWIPWREIFPRESKKKKSEEVDLIKWYAESRFCVDFVSWALRSSSLTGALKVQNYDGLEWCVSHFLEFIHNWAILGQPSWAGFGITLR